jgi:hypothetical protein
MSGNRAFPPLTPDLELFSRSAVLSLVPVAPL